MSKLQFLYIMKLTEYLSGPERVCGGEEAFSLCHSPLSEMHDLIRLLFLFSALAFF